MITRREPLQLLGRPQPRPLGRGLGPSARRLGPERRGGNDLAVARPARRRGLGPADAKVTIIEYASLTCSHCAKFHETTYPELKKRYIDTGKVRFILREFPLDPLATGRLHAGALRRRRQILTSDHRPAVRSSGELAGFTDKPLDALQQMMRQSVFHRKNSSCLRDQKLYDA